MLGFLIKDYYTLKKQSKIMLIILIFYMVLGMINDSPSLFLIFLPIFSSLMPLTALAYDERNNCDKLFLCMPFTRRDLVNCRYILAGLLCLLSGLIGIISSITIFQEQQLENLLLSVTFFGIGLFFFSINFPIALTLGVEKSRYIMFGILLIPSALGAFFLKKGYLSTLIPHFNSVSDLKPIIIGIIIVSLLSFLISWVLSIRLYEKREL